MSKGMRSVVLDQTILTLDAPYCLVSQHCACYKDFDTPELSIWHHKLACNLSSLVETILNRLIEASTLNFQLESGWAPWHVRGHDVVTCKFFFERPATYGPTTFWALQKLLNTKSKYSRS